MMDSLRNKTTIINRKRERIVALVDEVAHQKGLAFVMHGLGGFKEQPHIRAMAGAFVEKGYTTVCFDTTNSFGESDGRYEDAAITNYYEDLEDVIAWAKGESWHHEPFVLAGHSLGGMCSALYAEKNPHRVSALVLIASAVSGALTTDIDTTIAEWERTGWRTNVSITTGKIKRLPWTHMVDRLKYDLLPEASRITMPVLMVVGEEDDITPPDHQRILFDALLGPKEYHVIAGAPHTFRGNEHIEKLKQLFLQWLETSVVAKKV